ncbi:MAG: DUF4249 domain-containing protein [Saprospiraceae bacterium]|nr:DUF4249 domain-containing protein [Saprospiraceae bacterium]
MKLRIWPALLITLSLSACVDSYEFDTPDDVSFLVVDGRFTLDAGPHRLRLVKTTRLRSLVEMPVDFADVYLVDETGQRERYTQLGEGEYELNPQEISGVEGRQYWLEIELSNGSKYATHPQRMPGRLAAQAAEFEIDGRVLNIYVSTLLPAGDETLWLRWGYDEVYAFPGIVCNPFGNVSICYFYKRPVYRGITTLSTEGLTGSSLEKVKVTSDEDLRDNGQEFRGRHYYNVYQHSISEEAYEYWLKINQVTVQTGSIFDAPAAGVPGNAYNIDDPQEVVLGFFEVSNVDTVRTFILPGDIPPGTIPDFCPNINSWSQYLGYVQVFQMLPKEECCFCGTLPGDHIVKPDWF